MSMRGWDGRRPRTALETHRTTVQPARAAAHQKLAGDRLRPRRVIAG